MEEIKNIATSYEGIATSYETIIQSLDNLAGELSNIADSLESLQRLHLEALKIEVPKSTEGTFRFLGVYLEVGHKVKFQSAPYERMIVHIGSKNKGFRVCVFDSGESMSIFDHQYYDVVVKLT